MNDILKHFQEVSVIQILLWQRLNFSSSLLRVQELFLDYLLIASLVCGEVASRASKSALNFKMKILLILLVFLC